MVVAIVVSIYHLLFNKTIGMIHIDADKISEEIHRVVITEPLAGDVYRIQLRPRQDILPFVTYGIDMHNKEIMNSVGQDFCDIEFVKNDVIDVKFKIKCIVDIEFIILYNNHLNDRKERKRG